MFDFNSEYLFYFVLGFCFYAIYDMLYRLFRIYKPSDNTKDTKNFTAHIGRGNHFRSNNGWFACRDRLPIPLPEKEKNTTGCITVALPVLAWLAKYYRQAVVMFVLHDDLSYHFYELCDDDWAYFHKTQAFMLQDSIDRTNEVIYWRYLLAPPDMNRLPRYEKIIEIIHTHSP